MKDLQFGGNMYIVLVYDPLIVLIESDWNLKCFKEVDRSRKRYSINRIRLEFKVNTTNILSIPYG